MPVDETLAQRDLVVKLLSKISEEDRSLMLLKEVEGHSVEELAEMTGMNENTIKVKLFRTRQKLVKAAQRLGKGGTNPFAAWDNGPETIADVNSSVTEWPEANVTLGHQRRVAPELSCGTWEEAMHEPVTGTSRRILARWWTISGRGRAPEQMRRCREELDEMRAQTAIVPPGIAPDVEPTRDSTRG